MRHRFSYLQTGVWYRPIIPVSLKYKNKDFRYLALIDSGADFNIFHSDIAKILGIDLSKIKRSITFGGIREGSIGTGYFVDLEIGVDGEYIKTPTVFSPDVSENGYGVLGQQGFFSHFGVEFEYSLKNIIIQSYI